MSLTNISANAVPLVLTFGDVLISLKCSVAWDEMRPVCITSEAAISVECQLTPMLA